MNGFKSTHVLDPVAISSAHAFPLTGPCSIPQQEWPALIYNPSQPGTAEITGRLLEDTGK